MVCIDTCVPFFGPLAMEALHRQVLPIPIEAPERRCTARSSTILHSMANNQSAPPGRCIIVFDNLCCGQEMNIQAAVCKFQGFLYLVVFFISTYFELFHERALDMK